MPDDDASSPPAGGDSPSAAASLAFSPAQRQLLADAGFAWAQGWLFSAAVPGKALPQALARLDEQAVALARCGARSC